MPRVKALLMLGRAHILGGMLLGSGLFLTIGFYVAAKPAGRPAEPNASSAAELTFERRVSYQRVIEDVYWRHRLWPQDNPGPKPSLDAVLTQEQIETKVDDYLARSRALSDNGRPITAEQLQAEMDRMAENTKQPEVLRELFAALGNDPFIIAECLARPALSGRSVNEYSILGQQTFDSIWTWLPGQRSMASTGPGHSYRLPNIADGAGCIDDTWTATNIAGAPVGRIDHTAVWTGSEMIVWGGLGNTPSPSPTTTPSATPTGSPTVPPPPLQNTGGRYDPATDTWTATNINNAPLSREYHTAVWTGLEMIVWGGNRGNYEQSGGRYNPVSDTWSATSLTNAPRARWGHTAVWTGTQMVVWGGVSDAGFTEANTGGRYDPATNSWTPTTTANAPGARERHNAVWTGSEMIVWGGTIANGLTQLNTGGRYNPGTDSWSAVTQTNAPAPRFLHSAVWTGSEMIVWGGIAQNLSPLMDGGRYRPDADSWAPTSLIDVPENRATHSAIWTGNEMIIWGGFNLDSSGGRYDPVSDRWAMTSTSNAPPGTSRPTAVWTGSEMIVWGGEAASALKSNMGGRYCAQSGPTATPTTTPTTTPTATPTATPPFPPCGGQQTVNTNNFDNVTPPTLPPGWAGMNGVDPDGIVWQTSNAGAPSPPAASLPNALWVNAPDLRSDKYLVVNSPTFFEDSWAQLRFSQNFNFESGFDGGVLELSDPSVNGGAFTDITDPAIGGSFETGGYNSTISSTTDSPIAGRAAWSGNSNGFVYTIVHLRAQLINGRFRWRSATDTGQGGDGWRIDDVTIADCHFFGTPTASPTNTLTPTNTPTNTPTASPTITSTPTNTPTDTPTSTPTNTPTSTPTNTPTSTPTDTPTTTPTITPIPTKTISPTATPTPPPPLRSRADFDGDGRTDVSVYRPTNGYWYWQGTTTGFGAVQFGDATDIPAPADFDNDGRVDVSLYRPSTGFWYRLNSSDGAFSYVNFGLSGDIPQAGDFDGDGRADQAVFRPSNGTWYWLRSIDGQYAGMQFGQNGDRPVAADYDGDGRPDVSVFRGGLWYRINSSDGSFYGEQFGIDTDLAVAADYNGDGRDDIAVFRPSEGNWYFHYSGSGQYAGVHWGQTGDIPVPGDYDGDGRDDIAVYRGGTWYISNSTGTPSTYVFGLSGDLPIPNMYIR